DKLRSPHRLSGVPAHETRMRPSENRTCDPSDVADSDAPDEAARRALEEELPAQDVLAAGRSERRLGNSRRPSGKPRDRPSARPRGCTAREDKGESNGKRKAWHRLNPR